MSSDLRTILRLEAPIIVEIGSRAMSLREVMDLSAGAIIELPKGADEELELKVNNKAIGAGVAVKVGENFGIQLTFIGDARSRLDAMAGDSRSSEIPQQPEQTDDPPDQSETQAETEAADAA